MADKEIYTCDICHKVIKDGESVHSLFWDDQKMTGRHYECHDESKRKGDAAIKDLKETADRLHRLLGDLKRKI